MVAAAAVDFLGAQVLSRGLRSATQAIRLNAPLSKMESAFSIGDSPEGSSVSLELTDRRSVKGSTMNCYLGKGNRVGRLAQTSPRIAASPDVALVSNGGSMGPLLVALGSIDSAVESTKGFKLLDISSGLFLADGAGAIVERLEETDTAPFEFGVDRRLEAIFEEHQSTWGEELEKYRVRFLVAATRDLADDLKGWLWAKDEPDED